MTLFELKKSTDLIFDSAIDAVISRHSRQTKRIPYSEQKTVVLSAIIFFLTTCLAMLKATHAEVMANVLLVNGLREALQVN